MPDNKGSVVDILMLKADMTFNTAHQVEITHTFKKSFYYLIFM